jgi:hypothetical protein
VDIPATSDNIPGTLVLRDNSGGFALKPDSIVNADVSATAAIAGTKVSPNFGSQNITTTGVVRLNGAPGGTFGAILTGVASPQLTFINNADANNQPFIVLAKSRADGLVNGVDVLGAIVFQSHDGTAYRSTAGITAASDGSASASSLPSHIRFATTPSGSVSSVERMRIDSSGNVLVGKTASNDTVVGFTARPDGFISSVRTSNPLAVFNRLGIDGSVILFRKAGSDVGSISVTTTATAFNTSSDYRLKQNVEPMVGGLAKLNSLAPKTFEFKAEPNVKVDGFIAHEVQAVVPQAVNGEKDGEEMQGLDHSKLVPVLVAAVQELSAKVEALEALQPQ